MKQKLRVFILIVFVCVFMFSCEKKSDNTKSSKILPLVDQSQPILTIGSEDEEASAALYKAIPYIYVDYIGNIYIPDMIQSKFDKYDISGNLLCSFGKKGEGPGEHTTFPAGNECIAVDSNENIYVWQYIKKKLMIYSKNGNISKEVKILDDSKNFYFKRFKIGRNDNFYVLFYNEEKGYVLGIYNHETQDYSIFHEDKKRIRPDMFDLLPDFDLDNNNNIYIGDTIDYKIYKYSPSGELIETFERKSTHNKILESDFNVLMTDNKIVKIPNHFMMLRKLTDRSGFFPNIIGINVDDDRIYVWTSNQDPEKRFIIDIFDLDFNFLCKKAYYNHMMANLAKIKNRKLYIMNIESDDMEFKKQIGRFGVFNIPYKLNVYRISDSIYMK